MKEYKVAFVFTEEYHTPIEGKNYQIGSKEIINEHSKPLILYFWKDNYIREWDKGKSKYEDINGSMVESITSDGDNLKISVLDYATLSLEDYDFKVGVQSITPDNLVQENDYGQPYLVTPTKIITTDALIDVKEDPLGVQLRNVLEGHWQAIKTNKLPKVAETVGLSAEEYNACSSCKDSVLGLAAESSCSECAEESFNAETFETQEYDEWKKSAKPHYISNPNPRKKYERNYKDNIEGSGEIVFHKSIAVIDDYDGEKIEHDVVIIKEKGKFIVGFMNEGYRMPDDDLKFYGEKTFKTLKEAKEYISRGETLDACEHDSGFKLSDPDSTFYDSHETFDFYCVDCGITALGDVEPNFRYFGEGNEDFISFDAESEEMFDCSVCEKELSESNFTKDDELCDGCLATHKQCSVCQDYESNNEMTSCFTCGQNYCGSCDKYDLCEEYDADYTKGYTDTTQKIQYEDKYGQPKESIVQGLSGYAGNCPSCSKRINFPIDNSGLYCYDCQVYLLPSKGTGMDKTLQYDAEGEIK